MNKNLTFIFLLLLTYVGASAQNAYYDAVKLRTMINPATKKFETNKIDEVYQILKKYSYDSAANGPGNDDTAIDQSICAGITNDYLCGYFPAGAQSGTSVSSIFSTLGNYNGTNLFNGVSQFLIERAKAEVNEAFFIRLKGFLDKYPEFKTLFPNTHTFLTNFNSWEYANLLNTLREAFNKDMNLLPANIIRLKDLDINDCLFKADDTFEECKKCKKCCERVEKIKALFDSPDGKLMLSALKVADGIIQGQKVPQIINAATKILIDNNKADTTVAANISNSLQLLNIISLSLESNKTGKNYISKDEFDALSQDEHLQNLYMGLIFQQVKIANKGTGIVFHVSGDTIALTPLISKGHLKDLKAYIENVHEQAKNLQTAFDQLREDKLSAKADLGPDHAALMDAMRQLLMGLRATEIIDPGLVIPPDVDTFFNYTDQALQLTSNFLSKNYNAGVMDLLKMITDIVKEQKQPSEEAISFCNSFLKYASFAANIVEAKTPEEVRSAIEAMALPVGSYTIKQKSAFNISINAYVGYAWDFNKSPVDEKYAHGVYAPIGFSFNRGSVRSWGGVPITLFASVIDLGSFVSYNLQNTATDELKQEVRLESVFSPSLQLFFQVPRTPVTIGGGWRQTPKLFYTANDNTFVPIKSKSVFNISVLIDIPLFTLHNRPFVTAK
jgi:hypothetical protein